MRFILPRINKLFTDGDKVFKLEHIGIEFKVLVRGWEENLIENGDGILSTRKRCTMKLINYLLDLTLCLMMIQTRI